MAEPTQAGAESQAQPTGAEDAAHDPATGASNLESYEAQLAQFLATDGGESPPAKEDTAVAPAASAEDEAEEDGQDTGEVEEESEDDAVEAESEELPADDFEDPEDEPETEKVQERFRFKDDESKAIAAIAKAQGVSLLKAAEIYAKATKPEQSEEVANAEPVKSVADLKSELATLRNDLKTATTDMDFEKMAELQEQIELKRDEIDDAKGAEAAKSQQTQTAQDRAYNAAFDASWAKAENFYPDLKDPESPLRKKTAELDAFMEENGDPLFHSPDKPLILAKEAAKQLRIPMRNPNATPAPKKEVVKGRSAAQPASGNARTAPPPSHEANLDQDLAAAKTPAQYEAVLRKYGVLTM